MRSFVPGAGLAILVLAHLCSGCSSDHYGGAKAKAQHHAGYLDSLPGRTTEAKLEDWARQVSFHREKAELTAGHRQMLCFQVMPFSGFPGIYALLYRKHGDDLTLVSGTLVFRPPHFEKGQPLTFDYDSASDSVIVSSEHVECLRILMSWVWP